MSALSARYTVPVILLLLLGMLQYQIWTGRGSVQQVSSMSQALDQQRTANAQLQTEVARLQSEISDLKEKAWTFDVMLDGKKAASALSQERPTGDAIANITPLYSADHLRAAVAAEREACADAESDAGRLALELECLLQSISDMPTVSRWWESANEALDLHRSRLDAIRARSEKGDQQ